MQEELAGCVAIVAAHPDDEVIGAGALLAHLHDIRIIHITDGAPDDPSDARAAGFANSGGYAAARRVELLDALALAGISPRQTTCLGMTDQDTMQCLPELIAQLGAVLNDWQPDVVLTHPYEGGHPDHDSAAFAVSKWSKPAACRIFEMTSYHRWEGALRTGVFLPGSAISYTFPLADEDYVRKKRMLACFRSQQRVLSSFPVVPEQFRHAPSYDFTQPPHEGRLHYETLPWGITGSQWRELAARCL